MKYIKQFPVEDMNRKAQKQTTQET